MPNTIPSDSEYHNIIRAVARFRMEQKVTDETFAAFGELVDEAVLEGTTAHVYDNGAVEY